MKTMIPKPIKSTLIKKPVKFKSVYRVRSFIRMYPDPTHPEVYYDKEVKTRTARPTVLEECGALAYQFYDALEVEHLGVPIEPILTAPRNFSKMHYLKLKDED